MKLILDTHSFLYFIDGNSRLSGTARALIEDSSNEKWTSTASLWEMAIKVSLGKLELADTFDAIIPKQIVINGFNVLNTQIEHVSIVVKLTKSPLSRSVANDWDALNNSSPAVSQPAPLAK